MHLKTNRIRIVRFREWELQQAADDLRERGWKVGPVQKMKTEYEEQNVKYYCICEKTS